MYLLADWRGWKSGLVQIGDMYRRVFSLRAFRRGRRRDGGVVAVVIVVRSGTADGYASGCLKMLGLVKSCGGVVRDEVAFDCALIRRWWPWQI